MRVLFLHATRESTSEYTVHRLLADYANPARVACGFIWQTDHAHTSMPADDTVYWDFGRDMSLQPKPSRTHRVMLMARSFPSSFNIIRRKVDEFKPDVFYTSQQYYEVFLGRFFSRLYRIPHIIHISYPIGPWLGYFTLRSIRQTPNLIACSEYVRQSALTQGIQPQQIETLLHGADLSHFTLPKNRKWLHDWLGWPEECLIIVSVARIDPYKGHPDLIHAFTIAQKQMPQLRLAICGVGTTESDYEEKIRQLVVDLGINDYTAFLGYQKELPPILCGADIFCLPTQFDALPLAFLHAMSAGLPVVAVRSGGVPELVVEGDTGFLAEPGDVNTLAQHLLTLACNHELAEKMGEAGRLRATRDFKPEHIADQWADLLYRRLSSRSLHEGR